MFGEDVGLLRSRAITVPGILALLFLVYASVAIPLIAVLMPPFQAADELNHAERADQVALGTLIAKRSADGVSAGGPVHVGPSLLSAPFDPVRFHPRTKVTAAMNVALATPWGGLSLREFSNTAIYPPFFYLPSSVGLSAGRWLHLSVWHALILGRLTNGLASVLLVGIAIVLSGRFTPLLFTLSCLPMSLALFAAVSQDGPMIASAALGSVILSRRPGTVRTFWTGSVLVALVAMARPAYLPLCLVPLFATGQRWWLRALGGGMIAGAAAIWAMMMRAWVMPLPASHHIAAQIAAIRADPHLPILLAHTSLNRELVEGFPSGREFIGVLGWLDTTFPNPYYALTGCVLLVAAAVSGTRRNVWTATGAALIVLGSIVCIYAAQYLSWSGIGSAFIDGVQGRYFLPLAPFLVFVLPAVGWKTPRIALAGIALYPCLTVALTARAIVIRYGLG